LRDMLLGRGDKVHTTFGGALSC